MKEDILEQLVDDYLNSKGYFTKHNVKFRPRKDHPDFISNQDSNHSDIDVMGINPMLSGPDRVWVVSCKSWQNGLSIHSKIRQIEENQIISGREAWKPFRELVKPKWTEALCDAVKQETGEETSTYITAATRYSGDKRYWENYPAFQAAMQGKPIRLIALKDMVDELTHELGTTMASSQFGRTLQLFKAAGIFS